MIVVTGYPGFLGKRLVARLLEDDPKAEVVALVEPRMLEAARTDAPDRVELLGADIGEAHLGLPDDDWERLRAKARSIFHLAAIYDLSVPLEIAQRVNVDGTGHVLELCLECEKLERLNYVSTAYVAGARRGVVYEHELVLGQEFKNHYESTKFQAEVWVRELIDRVPTTVYRPAIVVGDSRTGETQKFDGPYYMLRVIAFGAERGWPIPQFGKSGAAFNVVPVDFVVDALVAGAAEPAAVGRTLHLVDPEPVTAAELMGLLAKEYAGREPSYRIPAKLVTTLLRFEGVRKQYGGAPPESIDYLNHPVRFDIRQASDVLSRSGLRVPRFEEYVAPLVEFFRAHEQDESFLPKRG